jgi:hypothetical protein
VKFAEGTTVPVEKTRYEIEGLLRKHGASEFSSGWTGGQAGISFVVHHRRVQFRVSTPTAETLSKDLRSRAIRLAGTSWDPVAQRNVPSAAGVSSVIAEEERRLWRCLLLAIKAKLEIVASGIATFDEEFLAHIVTEDGATIMERILAAEVNGRKLLPAVSS